MEGKAMVKTVAYKARKAIVKVAQRGAEKIRTVAGDAAGAAAQAAAGVVLESTANALGAGRSEVVQSTPRVKKTLGRAAKRAIGGRRAPRGRKRGVSRAGARKKTTQKKSAPKRATRRRSR
jgi:hypothetical protein